MGLRQQGRQTALVGEMLWMLVGIMMTAAAPGVAEGQTIYAANCAMCHQVMQPKLGDKPAWERLITRGECPRRFRHQRQGIQPAVLEGRPYRIATSRRPWNTWKRSQIASGFLG